MDQQLDKLTIYCDGACSGNPGPGGCACIIFNDSRIVKKSKYYKYATNQQMEISAVIMALKLLSKPYHIDIYTDSMYVINTATKWLDGWLENGLTKANMDLWCLYKQLSAKHSIEFHHIKGHSGDKLNEMCDKLAVGAYINQKDFYEVVDKDNF